MSDSSVQIGPTEEEIQAMLVRGQNAEDGGWALMDREFGDRQVPTVEDIALMLLAAWGLQGADADWDVAWLDPLMRDGTLGLIGSTASPLEIFTRLSAKESRGLAYEVVQNIIDKLLLPVGINNAALVGVVEYKNIFGRPGTSDNWGGFMQELITGWGKAARASRGGQWLTDPHQTRGFLVKEARSLDFRAPSDTSAVVGERLEGQAIHPTGARMGGRALPVTRGVEDRWFREQDVETQADVMIDMLLTLPEMELSDYWMDNKAERLIEALDPRSTDGMISPESGRLTTQLWNTLRDEFYGAAALAQQYGKAGDLYLYSEGRDYARSAEELDQRVADMLEGAEERLEQPRLSSSDELKLMLQGIYGGVVGRGPRPSEVANFIKAVHTAERASHFSGQRNEEHEGFSPMTHAQTFAEKAAPQNVKSMKRQDAANRAMAAFRNLSGGPNV